MTAAEASKWRMLDGDRRAMLLAVPDLGRIVTRRGSRRAEQTPQPGAQRSPWLSHSSGPADMAPVHSGAPMAASAGS